MNRLRSVGLGGRLLAIVVLVVSLDFLVNSVLFEGARLYAIREDDAAWMAERVILSHRVIDRSPKANRATVAGELSTERFTVSWSAGRPPTAGRIQLSTLRGQMLEAEPDLRGAQLNLKLLPLSAGGEIGGTTALRDGSFMTFNFTEHSPWSLNLGRLLGLALPSIALLLLAWLLSRAILRPLRALVAATSKVGAGDSEPLPEMGAGEVRHLVRAFNTMQERIHHLLASRAQTLLAIGHDLRTPLARMQLRIDEAKVTPETRTELTRDIEEMRALLQSLQTYVESGQEEGPRQRIDIAVTARTLIDDARDHGARAVYRGPPHLEILAHPVALRRALSNLLQNALAYAGNARIEIAERPDAIELAVDDDGPGIPEDSLTLVLQPFIRLDNARARNTAGMGLGLPIVDRAVAGESGALRLENKPGGGLKVTIRLPRRTD